MSRVVLLALTLSSSIAAAEVIDPLEVHAPGDQPDGYVAAGLVWDQSQGFASRGPMVEAGRRLGTMPVFARAMGQAGGVSRSDDPGTGTFLEFRGGLEGRACGSGGMVCGSAGVDVGYLSASFNHKLFAEDGSVTRLNQGLDAYLVVPRLTLDAGGRVRFRATFELPIEKRVGDSQTMVAARTASTSTTAESSGSGAGYAIAIALALGF
jgi:hypothetical protein